MARYNAIMHSLLAATTDFLGPIIPASIQDCPAGWGAIALFVNGLVSFAISIGIVIAILVLVYAAFLLVLNPLNAENRSKAKGMLLNAAIGLVIGMTFERRTFDIAFLLVTWRKGAPGEALAYVSPPALLSPIGLSLPGISLDLRGCVIL